MLNKTCTWMAKSAPYPPRPNDRSTSHFQKTIHRSVGRACTVIVYRLKYRDSARMLRRVTQPPHIAGPLALMNFATTYKQAYLRIYKSQL